jgi:hypothetical protein
MKRLFLATLIPAAMLLPVYAQTPEVARREGRQQARIAQGKKSGQLTKGETARLQNKESKIHHEIKGDRAANGGKLTVSEKAKVNRQQNKVSRRIYHDKHNARTRQ